MTVKDAFRDYLEKAIGHENALVALSAFDDAASVSVRRNPFKNASVSGREVPWSRHGRILEERPLFTLDPAMHAGGYYVQDSSSMFVGQVFRCMAESLCRPSGRPLRVLDLCAAPGGKTTDLAASLREMCGDAFVLVANEVMKARVGILADNVALWGDPNVVVTSDDPRAFASLPGFFDVILADVPCSGEGMFRKNEQAQLQWSEDNVALCEARQRRIIADVWPALAPGGILIYSTCTFNCRENDGNVEWIAAELGAEKLLPVDSLSGYPGVLQTSCGYSLVPGLVEGEGQYCSALKKSSSDFSDVTVPCSGKHMRSAKEPQLPMDLSGLLNRDVAFRCRKDMIAAVPLGIAAHVAALDSALHVVAAGCALGVIKGKDFVPDADLALSLLLRDDAFVHAEVDKATALSFLHKESIVLKDAPKGYVLICFEGLPLGFVKNLGNRCNNLHPQGRRIRMDINGKERS